VLEEILDEAKELQSFGSIDDIHEAVPDFTKRFSDERVRRGIPLKVILRDSPLARERQKSGPARLREVRLAPEGYKYSSVTYIWNDKVAMFSLTENKIAFVVESSELAEIQRAMFFLGWNSLPVPTGFPPARE